MANVEALLEAFEEPILLIAGNRLVAANGAARDIVGERMIGSDVRLAIRHPAVLDLVASGKAGAIDIEGIGRVDRPWRVLSHPLDNGDVLVRLIDQAAVRAAEQMRVDFVANASHELRTPLATILGYAETLAEPDDLPTETRTAFAQTVRAEARRMLNIIEDLMGLSRIEADRFIAPTSKLDLAIAVSRAIEDCAELARRRGCTISFDPPTDTAWIAGDEGQLVQMLDNVIGNAIRYGCNKEQGRVDIMLSQVRGRTRLEVRDYGEGIAPEHLPRLTQRFYRIDPARSRESGGTGLGLAIVKHIAERHRASLDIASALGKGTRVSLEFPNFAGR